MTARSREDEVKIVFVAYLVAIWVGLVFFMVLAVRHG